MRNLPRKNYGELITQALKDYSDFSPRSLQGAQGILGPSDIGFCRQKAALITKGVPRTDPTQVMPAAVGTAMHNYTEAALKATYPTWILGSIDNITVTATLPSGATISGHPDIIDPEGNALLDLKTKDGLEWAKRNGASQSNKYQRHLYVLGAIAAGLLDPSKPLYVGNAFLDRSGKNDEVITDTEEWDPTLTDEIDSWILDVTYAVVNDEDASRDVPAAICERICSHFTACRGGLESREGDVTIEDVETLTAVEMYVEGRELEKTGAGMKKEAQVALRGINGSTSAYQVRWVHIGETTVNSFEKAAFDRLDVRKVRK